MAQVEGSGTALMPCMVPVKEPFDINVNPVTNADLT